MATTKSWSVGEVLTAGDQNAYANLGQAWIPYTPAWTGTGGNPTIGNGTLKGRYLQLGAWVYFIAEATAGSTTTFGSGTYALALPVACRTTAPIQLVAVSMRDDSANSRYLGSAYMSGGSTASIAVYQGAAGGNLQSVTNLAPVTFAVNDSITAWGVYEAA
jgi:hypothetical protein